MIQHKEMMHTHKHVMIEHTERHIDETYTSKCNKLQQGIERDIWLTHAHQNVKTDHRGRHRGHIHVNFSANDCKIYPNHQHVFEESEVGNICVYIYIARISYKVNV